jgi:glutamine amidotransferase
LERKHPFSHATLSDQDLIIDFSRFAKPGDRVEVVVAATLTANECWTRFEPSERRLFTDGVSRRIGSPELRKMQKKR